MKPEPSRPSRRGSRRLRRILRDLHHQTWELELLISGLVTFALLQVPAPVDRTFNFLRVALPEGSAFVARLTFAYVKLAIYALLAAFLFHLAVRALWVALVGLDSVFPRGVRPERLRQGPLALEYIRHELPPVRRLIRWTDDVASVVFAAAFSIVAVFAMSIPTFGGLLILAYAVAAVLPGQADAVRTFWWVWGLFLAMAIVPTLLDRTVGGRLPAGSGLRRGLKGLLKWFYRVTGYSIYGPIQLTLASNLGSRTTGIATALLVVLLGGVFMVRDVMVSTGTLQLAGSPYLPVQASEVSLNPAFYDDLRDPSGGSAGLPSIESQVTTGPFVRLFVPYHPPRMDPAVEARCADLEPVGRTGIRAIRSSRADATRAARVDRTRHALGCAAAAWNVTLNDHVVGTDPVFGRHPRSGLPGLQYMIPTGGLTEGRQVLRVTEVLVGSEPQGTDPRAYPIVFWWGSSR